MIHMPYRAHIDGLRAISVLLVLFFHAHLPHFAGGFVGVDVFFVISGYLITSNLLRDNENQEHLSLASFYARRLCRLAPNAIVTTLVVLAILGSFYYYLPGQITAAASSAQYSALSLPNFFFWQHTGGYFDTSTAEMPFLHFWSLGVEEQFYLTWPLICLAIFKFSPKIRMRRAGTVVTILICALSFSCSLFLLDHEQASASFFLPFSRAWEISAGCLLAFTQTRWPHKKFFANLAPTLGITLIVWAAIATHTNYFPSKASLVAIFGCILILITDMGATQRAHTSSSVLGWLGAKPLTWVGQRSYSIYLWHWPLCVFLRMRHAGMDPSLPESFTLIIASIAIGAFAYATVETPLRRRGSSASLRTVLAVFIPATLLIIVCSSLLKVAAHRNADRNVTLRAINETSSLGRTCIDQPAPLDSDRCTLQPKASGTKIIVWGDSMANSLMPLFEDYAKSKNVSVTLYAHSSTPPYLNVPDLECVDPAFNKKLLAVNSQVIEDISRLARRGRPLSAVIFAFWESYGGDAEKRDALLQREYFCDRARTRLGSLKVMRDALAVSLARLREVGVQRFLIILPFATFKSDNSLECAGRLQECAWPRAQADWLRKDVVENLRRATATMNDVCLLEPLAQICDERSCPMFDNNDISKPLASDSYHPTAYAVRKVGAAQQAALDWLASGKGPCFK